MPKGKKATKTIQISLVVLSLKSLLNRSIIAHNHSAKGIPKKKRISIISDPPIPPINNIVFNSMALVCYVL